MVATAEFCVAPFDGIEARLHNCVVKCIDVERVQLRISRRPLASRHCRQVHSGVEPQVVSLARIQIVVGVEERINALHDGRAHPVNINRKIGREHLGVVLVFMQEKLL